MINPVLLASGDPVVFLLIGGTLLLAIAVLTLGITGIVFLFGKSAERRKRGKRLLLAMLGVTVLGAIMWVSVVGLD